jgi:methyl-galactoside transport system substrate-binding protein
MGLLTVGILSLASCSSSTSLAQIFLYDATDPFIQLLSGDLVNDIKDFIPYQLYDAAREQTTQNDGFLKAVSDKNTKILIMNIVDRLASSALIEKAEETNIPLVFINREPLTKDLTVDDWAETNCYYCGSDPKYEGELQADIVNDFFHGPSGFYHSKWDKNKDGKLQVAILKGELGHQDSEYRTEYCVSTLIDFGFDVDIIDTQYCNWERSKAYDAMKTMYDPSAADPIELLFSNNDEMALGAIQYLEDNYVNASPSLSSSSKSYGLSSGSSIFSSSSSSGSSSPSSGSSSSADSGGSSNSSPFGNSGNSSGSSIFSSSSSSGGSGNSSSSTSPAQSFSERFFPIIGVDATADGRAAVEAGTLTGTVLNDASLQATVIKAIIRHLLYQEPMPVFGDRVETPDSENQKDGNSYKIKGEKVTKNTE